MTHSLGKRGQVPRAHPEQERRIAAATWTCPTCGVIPPLVTQQGALVLVHRQACPCERAAERAAQDETLAQERQRQRDQARQTRAIGGMSPTMRAWEMRLDAFVGERQAQAFTAVHDWLMLVYDTARQARRVAQEHAQHVALGDPTQVDQAFWPAWERGLVDLPNLVLTGGTGVGKTHLCVGLFHSLIDADLRPFYAPGLVLLDAIRERWDREDADHTEEQLVLRLISADVLLLDGPDRSSRPWSTARWFRILDGRSAAGRPTVVAGTSETSLVGALGPDGYDRLCEGGCVLHLRGSSYRRQFQVTPAALHQRALGLPPASEEG